MRTDADFRERRGAFESATAGITFTKDFNPALEAVMYDPLETIASRVLAWIKRTSWGNQSLYCIRPRNDSDKDGRLMSWTEAFQVDCARDLGIDKRRVSAAMSYFVRRGYAEMRGTAKMIYPIVSPVLADPPNKDEKSAEYRTFLQDWKVSHSTDFQELEVACSTVKRLRKVLLCAYKEWRTSRTSASDSNKEERKERHIERTPLPPDNPSQVQVGRPVVDDSNKSLKNAVEEHLNTFPIPDPLTPETIEEVARHITTPENLEQFKAATSPDRLQARKWILLIRIAERVARDGPRYAKAMAAAHSATESKADAIARRIEMRIRGETPPPTSKVEAGGRRIAQKLKAENGHGS